jgi:predicted nuclease of predicted toxin-antitoxin system
MRIKLDENLPGMLIQQLGVLGHDVDSVPLEGIAGHPDPEVWSAAQDSRRFLITQDLDFSDIRQFLPGTHHGLMLVRLRVPGRLALTKRIEEVFRIENPESWARCFVVVSDLKIRVSRPDAEV